LALVAALCLTVAGCSQPSTGGSGGGGEGGDKTVTVALAEQPDALDPTVASTYVGRIVFANMCEKLYDTGDGLGIEPQLAAGMPQISDGGKTYTIPLRKNVKFNDGTTFDADAVKTTLEHYINDPKSARAAELAAIDSVEVVDPSTVRLHLKAPYSPLTAILADRSGMILSPKQLDKLGDDFGDHPVCVGPFSFKDRPSADKIDLVKSQYYYDKDQVQLQGVTFLAVTQPNVRAANLRSGDVDIADRIAPPDVSTLKGQSDVVLDPVTSLGYQGITLNVSNSNGAGSPKNHTVSTPLAEHPELRKAFSLSLNRDTINQVVFQGQYVPACSPISPNSPYAPTVSCDQDLAEAKKLVAQSGVKTPIPVNLIVEAANSEAAKLGTVIQSMAKKAGFAVHVQATEFTTALTQAQKGNFQAFQVGWSGRLDPDQNISPFWDGTSTLNYSGANYPDVQKLLEQERATTDTETRKAVFQKLSESFLEHGNIVYLYYPKVVLGYRSEVKGIEYRADGLIHLKTAHVTG
jgi:peptide/nickel transport system substrate-binding protein